MTRSNPSSSKPLPNSRWWRLLLFALVGALLTLVFLWPLVAHISSRLTSHDDGLLIGWTVNWVSRALVDGKNVYQAPFLHPYPDTLAFSQLFLPTGMLNIPFYLARVPLVAAENLHFLLGSMCMFVAMALLCWELTRSVTAALIGAALFVFSPFHLEFVVHLHIYLLAGLPILAWSLLRFARSASVHRPQYAWLWSLALLYQALNDPHGAFYGMAISAILALCDVAVRTALRIHWRDVIVPAVFLLTVTTLAYVPYLQVSRTFEYTRSIRDAAHFSYSLDRLWQVDVLAFLVLSGGLWRAQRASSRRPSKRPWLTICILGLVLMLGPVLKIHDQTFKVVGIPIPLPYAIAYYLVPGFQAMRSATRWLVVANFGAAILVSILATQSRLSQRAQWALFSTIVVACWALSRNLVQVYPVPTDISPSYQLLQSRPESVLAEFPMFHWDMAPYTSLEAERLLYQAHHGKSLFNGITGFTPPARLTEIISLWQHFPDSGSLQMLREQGVQLVLIHFDEYQHLSSARYQYGTMIAPSVDQLRQSLAQQPELTRIACQENDCLYSLEHPLQH